MTAYGRAKVSGALGELVVELLSVNRKHFDLKFHLPKELVRFESDIRQWIVSHLGRGMITIKASIRWSSLPPTSVYVNDTLLKELVSMRKKAESAVCVEANSTHLIDWAFKQEGVLVHLDEKEDDLSIRTFLEEGIQEALKPFLQMKEREGKTLSQDMQKRLAEIFSLVKEVDELSDEVKPHYHERISKVLAEFTNELGDQQERILREVALLADRADIKEEITRLESHLSQLDLLLKGGEVQVGKTIEFVLQEMFREVNTIASKASDVRVSHLVVKMKTHIERIKEQVQNVE
ncbi:YicC family protein [Chlamydiales bacterium]|nr:YicC family protein [Chlamydiales bacterium]